MTLSEFDIIERYFVAAARQYPLPSYLRCGIGDDCALIDISSSQTLALSCDTFIEGAHFPRQSTPSDIAMRCVTAAMSDLAAMGAKPLGFMLALTLPHADTAWLQSFSEGLCHISNDYQVPLIGGNTAKGPLSLTVQVQGCVPQSKGLMRSGAQAGDNVFVSGTLGDATVALAILESRLLVQNSDRQWLLSRFYRPQARIELGQRLLNIAHAAIDVSDGLLADLSHMVNASGVGAEIMLELLPLSGQAQTVCHREQLIDYALSGGDDYELCFTASADQTDVIMQCAHQIKVPITMIGRIITDQHVYGVDRYGNRVVPEVLGYRHF